MATNETTANRPSFWGALSYYVMVIAIVVFISTLIFMWWPAIMKRVNGIPLDQESSATATATQLFPTRAALGGSGGGVSDPIAVATPIPGLAQNEATATAQYNQAVQESQHGAVVLPANDPAPIQFVSQEVERLPAGDTVPTAEPRVEGAPVVNIQETQTCLHGQVWTAGGCKNPDSKGSKSRP